jgi:two-component sensor histidine kinase
LQDGIRLLHRTDSSKLLREAIYAFVMIGDHYATDGRADLSMDAAQQAILFDKSLDQHDAIPLSLAYGLALEAGHLQAALNYALDAVRLTESAPPGFRDGIAYASAGNAYLLLKNFPKSLEYYRKAFNTFALSPSEQSTPNHNFMRGMVLAYLDMGRPADALAFLDTADKKLPARNDLDRSILDDSKADCYAALKRYELAEYYYQQALKGYVKRPLRKYSTYINLSKVYFSSGQYQKAMTCLSELLADSNRSRTYYMTRREAHLLLYRIDTAVGNFRDASAHLLRYEQIKDSAFNDSVSRQMQEMTAKYETERKDRNIAELNGQAKVREAELARSRTLRNTFISVSLLLVLVVVLLYSRYRIRQRSNRMLKEMNDRQYQLLVEKEWLMREVHHRVKNNLQLVISLMNMQASSLKDELALSAFEEIRSRIHAISLIHQRLYRAQAEVTSINMREYIAEIVSFLQNGLSPGERIGFRLDVDALDLDVSQCVPVGLILNEAVTNAIKYAFPESNEHPANTPTIEVELKQTGQESVRLVVADNGIGLPPDFEPGKADSMGMQLIRNLSLQLNGLFFLERRPGLAIAVVFPTVSNRLQ